MDGTAQAGLAAGAEGRPRRAFAARLNTFLFRHHRWFGVVSCVALMAWGASGVLHPLIGRLGPQAATMAPPPARLDLHALPEPGELIRRAGIRQAAGLRLVALTDGGQPRQAWQVTLPGAAGQRYLDAADGAPVDDGDARYAVALARHYSGQLHGAVKRVRLVTRFDDDYLPGNRLLPVYRVDFDRPDGLRAYVETSPPRLARLTDDGTARLGRLFRVLHDWSFLEQAQALRVGLLSLLLAATLASAVSGLWMYGFLWRRGTLDRRRRPLQRWHRVVGLIVSVSALGFAASAQWRLLADDPPAAPVRAAHLPPLAADLSWLRLPEALRQGLWDSVELGGLDAVPYYRVMAAGHHGRAARTLDAATGTQDDDAERRHALRLAARFSGLDEARLREAVPVTRFDGEYRFSQRRLPVWRVASDVPGAATWYVEPTSGVLAAAVGRWQRLEGWSFGHLHMFHWLDFAGRNVRDAALALFGLGNLLVAALGLWLFLRRYGRRGRPSRGPARCKVSARQLLPATAVRLLRLAKIAIVSLRYGLDQMILEHEPTGILLKLARFTFFWRDLSASRSVRLRQALEALGPIFVKFGQVLSTRRDLLSPDLADELAKLQDRVPPFPSEQAVAQLETFYGKPVGEVFAEFHRQPVASASVAQVHFARLHTGEQVAVKILRPGIERVIAHDLELLDTFAMLVEKLWSQGRRLKPREVVAEFRKHLADELDLMREAANCSQLRRNFANSHLLAVPEVYWDYCGRDVMVMQRMYGTPISQVHKLTAQGVDLKVLSRMGVEIFFTQVFRDGFFHADMHPGNIFVNNTGQYVALDFGIMGTLTDVDKNYLAQNFLAFFQRDYKRVAQAHVDAGWVPKDTRVDEFEAAIRSVCEPIFDKPLKEIEFGRTLLRLFQVSRRFNVEIQPQLVLLQKTLLNIEGLGRQLDPDLDLWSTAKPFLERWMTEQVGPGGLLRNLAAEAPGWAATLPMLPRLIHRVLSQPGANPLAPDLARLAEATRRQNRLVRLGLALLAGLLALEVWRTFFL